MLYLLYETPIGLFLFKKRKFDEIASDSVQIAKAIRKLDTFSKMVKMQAVSLFPDRETAMSVLRGLIDGEVSPFLAEFLSTYIPEGKKAKLKLAIQDTKLARKLSTELGYVCTTNNVIFELFRGIKFHFNEFVKGKVETQSFSLTQACIGMGHTISRNLIQFDINKQDKGIIHSFSLLETLEKNLNTFVMRLKEWYGNHFPELIKLVGDNETFTKVANFIGSRATLSDESVAELEELVLDGEVAQKIVDLSKISIGNDLQEVDEESIKTFSNYLLEHFEFRRSLQDFLKEKMEQVSPNLASLIGDNMGAKMLTHAGGLTNLSKLPASTIQILGAENALFRALKKKSNMTPKYGFIFNSTFITRAEGKNKGKISRFLANKCALAARLDAHLKQSTNRFGAKMREQVEERLMQLKNGTEVSRNEAVLEEVVNELQAEGLYVTVQAKAVVKGKKSKKVKKKKAKKSKKVVEEEDDEEEEEAEVAAPPKKKKKKKKKKKVVVESESDDEE